MGLQRCLACGRPFRAWPQVPNQAYCSDDACQRERRRLWQKDKRRSDDDYRENQARAQQKWLATHQDYWQKYRAEHPQYTEHNRARQRARNAAKRGPAIAKMDESVAVPPFPSGTYRLSPAQAEEVAKMDAWIVKITLLSGA